MSTSPLPPLLRRLAAPPRRRTPRKAATVDIPGVGQVKASTLRRWIPVLGGLLTAGGTRRRRRASEGSGGGAGTPGAGGTGLWIFGLLALALFVWWLADGGAATLRSFADRLSAPEAAPSPAAAAAPEATPAPSTRRSRAAAAAPSSPEVLSDGLWWEGTGVVEKVLPDDEEPPRHQRFFLRDDRGRSIFFAHNVDVAPRVPGLSAGETISFRGEWRDNDRGGAMHWTHRDPEGRRKGGWLERAGVRYE